LALSGRRRAFIAAFLGWMLDGYDFTNLTLVLIDIGRDFQIDHRSLAALRTVTLVMRLAGGMMAGAAADRWGRKLPLMVSIAWFSVFAFANGLAVGTLTIADPQNWVALFACLAVRPPCETQKLCAFAPCGCASQFRQSSRSTVAGSVPAA